MKKLLFGLIALPLLTSGAMAQKPVHQLTDTQMDKVTAGADLHEVDVSNTAITWAAIYNFTGFPATPAACSCYLYIVSPAGDVGVAAAFR